MKRKMMMISIAVAALLLCAENVQAQSRVVRRARTEREDERHIRQEDPRRSGRRNDIKPEPRKIKVVDNDVIRAFEREIFDSNRLRMADMIFSTGGFMNVSQIIKVSLIFDYDSNRQEFLMKAYRNCVDRHNYYKVLATLDFSSSRENVIKFVTENRERREPELLHKVSSSDMSSIIKALKREDFDSTRSRMAKMITAGSLLTSRQIADMAKTFDFENSCKDFLLYAFRNCIDPENYYIAVNTLNFSSSRNEVMRKISRN